MAARGCHLSSGCSPPRPGPFSFTEETRAGMLPLRGPGGGVLLPGGSACPKLLPGTWVSILCPSHRVTHE